jgi:hypothetical protein
MKVMDANGSPLDPAKYTIDNKVFKSNESNIEIRCNEIGWIFDIANKCTIKTLSECIIKAGGDCDIKTGSDSIIETDAFCFIDTQHACIIKCGSYSIVKTKHSCTIETGSGTDIKCGKYCSIVTSGDTILNIKDHCILGVHDISTCTFKKPSDSVVIDYKDGHKHVVNKGFIQMQKLNELL